MLLQQPFGIDRSYALLCQISSFVVVFGAKWSKHLKSENQSLALFMGGESHARVTYYKLFPRLTSCSRGFCTIWFLEEELGRRAFQFLISEYWSFLYKCKGNSNLWSIWVITTKKFYLNCFCFHDEPFLRFLSLVDDQHWKTSEDHNTTTQVCLY